MLDFTYYSPIKLYFGKGEELNAGKYVREYGGSRVLLHYGGGSVVRSGLLGLVREKLEAEGMAVFELGGAQPNPRVELCREGIALCREKGIDFIIALGGGSSMDSAKLIALGACFDGDPWDIVTGAHRPEAALPVATIPTLAATGSENNGIFVITNGDKKLGQSSPLAAPKFSILNPELTCSVSPWYTAAGAVDMITHIIGSYLNDDWTNELMQKIVTGAIKTVIKYAPKALENPEDYEARAQLMWISSLCCCPTLTVGLPGDGTTHIIEGVVDGIYDKTHGATLSVVLLGWMKYIMDACIPRFAEMAVRLFDVEYDHENPRLTALEGIHRFEQWIAAIGMPTRFSQLGIDDARFDEIAARIYAQAGVYGNMVKLGEKETREILALCK